MMDTLLSLYRERLQDPEAGQTLLTVVDSRLNAAEYDLLRRETACGQTAAGRETGS